jgi:hypothetical protein
MIRYGNIGISKKEISCQQILLLTLTLTSTNLSSSNKLSTHDSIVVENHFADKQYKQ